MKLFNLSTLAIAVVIGLGSSAPAAHAGAHHFGPNGGAFGYLTPLRQCADRAYANVGIKSPTPDQQTYINGLCYQRVYGHH